MYKKCYILCVLVLTLSVCCTGCSEKNKQRITAEAGENTLSNSETDEAGSELSEEIIASIPELIMKCLV